MFDLPPLEAEPPGADAALAAAAAEEAALAAEIALAIEAGGVADDAPDSRSRLRVDVSWPASILLPDGHVIELQVRNVSEGGVGLVSDEHIPACTVVSFAMDVPPLAGGGRPTSVEGTIKTTYTVARGDQVFCGGTWQAPPAGARLLTAWIAFLA